MAHSDMQPFRFLDLPGELRNQIYKYSLDARINKHENYQFEWQKDAFGLWYPKVETGTDAYCLGVQLFSVSKGVSQEALQVFHSTNTFIKLIISDTSVAYVRALLELFAFDPFPIPSSLSRACQAHALEVNLQFYGGKDAKAILLLPSFEAICVMPKLWLIIANDPERRHETTISLDVTNRYTTMTRKMRQALRDIWRPLHCRGKITVIPSIQGKMFTEELLEDVRGNKFDVKAWFLNLEIERLRAAKVLKAAIQPIRNNLGRDRTELVDTMICRVMRCVSFGYQAFGRQLVDADKDPTMGQACLRLVLDDFDQESSLISESATFSQAMNRLLLRCYLTLMPTNLKQLDYDWDDSFPERDAVHIVCGEPSRLHLIMKSLTTSYSPPETSRPGIPMQNERKRTSTEHSRTVNRSSMN
ncbi:MAG: hypothetical protein M1821_007342 [Bathelium mastoideum]|nr:MAG: hypothetical protein M1821_007342 [Bathelium mastoideum]